MLMELLGSLGRPIPKEIIMKQRRNPKVLNQVPKIDFDPTTCERIKIIPFRAKFTDNPVENDPHSILDDRQLAREMPSPR